jgi:hypothetical protein
MAYEEDYYQEPEEDKSFWDKQKRQDYHFGGALGSGSTSSFQCPQCGSWNTSQGTYFDKCNSCDYGVGY